LSMMKCHNQECIELCNHGLNEKMVRSNSINYSLFTDSTSISYLHILKIGFGGQHGRGLVYQISARTSFEY
jgi:hypothetical protein